VAPFGAFRYDMNVCFLVCRSAAREPGNSRGEWNNVGTGVPETHERAVVGGRPARLGFVLNLIAKEGHRMISPAHQERHPMVLSGLLAAAAAVVGIPAIAVPAQVSLPLCQGFVVVTAVNQAAGDYESIKRVETMTPDRVMLSYDGGERKLGQLDGGGVKRVLSRRTVLRQDLEHGAAYAQVFADGNLQPEVLAGSTAIGISSDLYRQLKAAGHAPFKVADPSITPNFHPANDDGTGMPRLPGTLERVGSERVKVVVNGEMVALPALHAKADFGFSKGDLWILEDAANPLALRYDFLDTKLQVVRITCRCQGVSVPAGTTGNHPAAPVGPQASSGGTSAAGQAGSAPSLEQRLAETGHAAVYDIYFDFSKDSIRTMSEPTLREIADVLKRHPDWSLVVEGHTDNIGGSGYNLDLSTRRAAAVKRALVGGFAIADNRLSTSGFGMTRPVDTNDTLEGRAHNRRVELRRR
jgi:outer membrane protein OmpA-like peptidoglycan-associated protein